MQGLILESRTARACFLTLILCCMRANAAAHSSSAITPVHSFDTYDLYQIHAQATQEQKTADAHPQSKTAQLQASSPAAMEEYAVCKTGAGACAATRLSCPATCVQKFFHYGYHHGYKEHGHGYAYGYHHGYEEHRHGYAYGYGYYRKGYGGGYGGGRYGSGRYGGGGGSGWASACKYDCAAACKATC